MLTKKLDRTLVKIGLLYSSEKTEEGYALQMLIRSKLHRFPCSREVYEYIDEGRFGHYPSVMELFYVPIFDENGCVVQLLQADRFQNEEGCLVETSFGLSTYAMLRYQITDKTLKSGDFFRLEGSVIRFADDFQEKEGQLRYLEYRGAIPKPMNGMMFKMADDFDIYTWDWADALAPFSVSCTREEAIANRFVEHFTVGKPEDVENAYWIWFGSLRGNDEEIDTVCCFLNKAPGWTY